MKISNTPQNYINQSYANQAAQTGQTPPPEKTADEGQTGDSINLSATTRDLQRISAASQTDPPGRAERVAELKSQVQANQYTINAEQVAEKMIGSIMDRIG